LNFLVRKGTVSQAAEKYPNDVILNPDAFCRAEEPAFVFSTVTETAGPLRSAQDDIQNIFSTACEAMPLPN